MIYYAIVISVHALIKALSGLLFQYQDFCAFQFTQANCLSYAFLIR